MLDDLIEQLQSWRETDGMSDDACRKLWLMQKAATELTRLRDELAALQQPATDEKLVEMAARAIRRKAAEIDHRPGNPTPDAMWFSDELGGAVLAAIASKIRAVERERCAAMVEPKEPRPCDCNHCTCNNSGDAEAVANWDACHAIAAAIRTGADDAG